MAIISQSGLSGITSITSSSGEIQVYNSSGTASFRLRPSSSDGSDLVVGSINSGPISGARNRIIDGAMEIDQRNSGASVTLNNNGGYAVDRFFSTANNNASGTGTATVQRVVDAPPGFLYSLKYTVTNAKSPASTDEFYIYQAIEGQNIIDFAFGTSAAKSITLSFWVKSSLTGTFSGFLRTQNASVVYRSYIFNYTINSANTWQYVTITAPGDTVQVPNLNNGLGIGVLFDLGSGSTYQTSTLNVWQTGNYYRSINSTSLISTNSATFQITGVQLELGTVATPFERRSYGQELTLCQRYYQILYNGSWRRYVANVDRDQRQIAVPMRATPILSMSASGSNLNANNSNATATHLTIDLQYSGGGTGVIDLSSLLIIGNAEL